MTYILRNMLTGEFAPVRQEVAEFALAMEQKFCKNDHKTGWKDQPIEAHIKLLRIEMMEFDVALEFLGDEEAMKECVDIANFALIIRDKLKARMENLKSPTIAEREEFRQALADLNHPEATVFGHWALAAYDKVANPELYQQYRDRHVIASAEIASEEP